MLVPTFNINISGNVVAAYAAIVSTCTGAVQLSNYLRDRSRIQLRVRHKMQLVGDPRWNDKNLTLVYVLNAGRRPATITTVGAQRLYPHNPFVIPNTNPHLPHELNEGQSLIAIIAEEPGLDFAQIDWWEAGDAVGRTYRLRVAPWYKHCLSNIRWKRQLRREAKEKAKKGK